MTTEDALTTLRDTRELLADRKRWCKITTHQGSRYCLLGAISEVSAEKNCYTRTIHTWEARVAIVNTIHRRYPWRVPAGTYIGVNTFLWKFNDSPFTHHRHVIRVLDATIARLERQLRLQPVPVLSPAQSVPIQQRVLTSV